jgi:hypothetical protein
MKNETLEGIEKGTYLLDGKGNGYHTYLIRDVSPPIKENSLFKCASLTLLASERPSKLNLKEFSTHR